MATPEALAMRRLRAKRKAKGVCIYCGASLLTETMCERCADRKRLTDVPAVMRNVKRYPVRRKLKKG